MRLVDTSVWVEHLRRGNSELRELLEAGEVACHPFVIGELASGTLARRVQILAMLADLPHVGVADHEEVLALVDAERLFGRGLAWTDLHLLAAARLAQKPLWTLDRELARAAHDLGVAAP